MMRELDLGLPPPPRGILDGASLFLDFDGTLVEIAARPDAVAVDERLRRLLNGLAGRLDGRLALVSGRPAAQVDGFFASAGIAIAGSHGAELWCGGRRSAAERPAALDGMLEQLHALATEYPGVLVEEKPLGAALHYREAPHAEEACRALAMAVAEAGGLVVQPGKMVFEIKAGGSDKGAAVQALMALPEFAGTRPVFVGDDLTDEAGFRVAAGMGGAGILVGAPRDTAAHWRLESVEAVLAWLESAA